jgi:hypothetical protein
MNLKTFTMRKKKDCPFGHYQQNHSRLREKSVPGGKMSKERITVLLCGHMVGQMEKPLLIGKAAMPRCFKNLNINHLPVIWRNNKKAWVTPTIMEEWLNMFNGKIKKENKIPFLFLTMLPAT